MTRVISVLCWTGSRLYSKAAEDSFRGWCYSWPRCGGERHSSEVQSKGRKFDCTAEQNAADGWPACSSRWSKGVSDRRWQVILSIIVVIFMPPPSILFICVCASRNIVNMISCRVFDTFLPNLHQRCVMGERWMCHNWESKGQRSRSRWNKVCWKQHFLGLLTRCLEKY